MSRRAEIADAAISTLARDGMRGLTHRAVDRAAGLPEGSASYYFRTRQALLQATVERLAELDATDVLASPGIPALPDQDLDAFAAAAAAIVESWLTAGRERQLARYELALEATRRPELRHALVASGSAIRAVVASQFAAAGVRQPASGRRTSWPSSTAWYSIRPPGPGPVTSPVPTCAPPSAHSSPQSPARSEAPSLTVPGLSPRLKEPTAGARLGAADDQQLC